MKKHVLGLLLRPGAKKCINWLNVVKFTKFSIIQCILVNPTTFHHFHVFSVSEQKALGALMWGAAVHGARPQTAPTTTRAWPGRGPKVSREGMLRLPHSNKVESVIESPFPVNNYPLLRISH